MSLLEKASLVVTPNAYKESKLYSVIPNTTLGDMDVVRATTATRVNEQGLIEVVPRNLVQYSEQFDNSFWIKSNTTVLQNNSIAPNGTNTAELVYPTTTGSNRLLEKSFSINDNTIYTGSWYIKAAGINWVAVDHIDGNVGAWFNLSTGTIGTISLGSTASIENVGNGWYRCKISKISGGTTGYHDIRLVDGDNIISVTANGTNGLFVWGAQLEQGSTATTYFPTTTRLNIPRIDYTNGSCPSLLVEPQRTNLASYSEDFYNAYWNVYNTTVTANTTISPDGTQNADTFVFDAVTTARLERAIGGAYENNTLTVSVYAKVASGTSQFRLKCTHASVADYFSSDLTVTTEWQRFTFTQTFGSTVGSGAVFGMLNSTNGTTKTIQFYGAQLEVGSYATSYIPTVASTVTRNADIISKTGISSLIGQTEGTMFLDFYYDGISNNFCLMQTFQNASPFNVIQLYFDSSKKLIFEVGADASILSTNAISAGRLKIAGAYKNNDFVLYLNGIQIGTDTSGNVIATDSITFNDYFAVPNVYKQLMQINSAQLYKTRLTNTELASLTTI